MNESSCDSSITHLLDVGIRSSFGNSQDVIQFRICHDSSLAAEIEELMEPGAGKMTEATKHFSPNQRLMMKKEDRMTKKKRLRRKTESGASLWRQMYLFH